LREVDTSNREFPNRSALGLYPKGGVGAPPLGSAFPGTPRDSENLAPDDSELHTFTVSCNLGETRASIASIASIASSRGQRGRMKRMRYPATMRSPRRKKSLSRRIRWVATRDSADKPIDMTLSVGAPRAPMFDFDGD
jgi:hypothetical protein